MSRAAANQVIEQSIVSKKAYNSPFNDVDVSALVSDPEGRVKEVPAFWAGGNVWKFRYASPLTGEYTWHAKSTDSGNSEVNSASGAFEITPYEGGNLFYKHGPVTIARDKRHFQHADGTPFFWLGDTWWMGLTKRLHWPDEFHQLATDRIKKGYTVIQIVAGLYPDMPAFDERGANEAGYPWTPDYKTMNPEYFDMADRRIKYLVDSGLSPCIVGAWGYFEPWMGAERLKKHWRYLVARYGAYPVFWCVAGEANLPYYLVPGFPFDDRKQVKGWTEVAAYLKSVDPFHRPLSIHPTGLAKLDARNAIDDTSLLDFDMLQTGHGDMSSLPPSVDTERRSYATTPAMPFLNSEVCYEGILGSCHDDIQRLIFWTSIMSGATGHTYGANGIWQLNRKDRPYGKSPHGGDYGPVPWDVAMNLPGSGQLGKSKQFLTKMKWWELEPKTGWATYGAINQPQWGDWIWYPEGNPAADAPAGVRYFRRAFAPAAGKKVQNATLRVSADDRFTAFVNGKEVGKGAGWNVVKQIDVTSGVLAGGNVLGIQAENMAQNVPANPAGLLCTLAIRYTDGTVENILSDSAWRSSDKQVDGWEKPGYDDSRWASAKQAAPYGGGPWGKAADVSPYLTPYAGGFKDGTRLIYLPLPNSVQLTDLIPNAEYAVEWFDPTAGKTTKLGARKAGANGRLEIASPTASGDWLLVLKPGK